jgi:hypothetical protein
MANLDLAENYKHRQNNLREIRRAQYSPIAPIEITYSLTKVVAKNPIMLLLTEIISCLTETPIEWIKNKAGLPAHDPVVA